MSVVEQVSIECHQTVPDDNLNGLEYRILCFTEDLKNICVLTGEFHLGILPFIL